MLAYVRGSSTDLGKKVNFWRLDVGINPNVRDNSADISDLVLKLTSEATLTITPTRRFGGLREKIDFLENSGGGCLCLFGWQKG